MSNHHGEIRMAGKVPRSTVSKIREILQANPGTTLRGSFGPDGQSHYALVPSAPATKTSQRRRLAVLRREPKWPSSTLTRPASPPGSWRASGRGLPGRDGSGGFDL